MGKFDAGSDLEAKQPERQIKWMSLLEEIQESASFLQVAVGTLGSVTKFIQKCKPNDESDSGVMPELEQISTVDDSQLSLTLRRHRVRIDDIVKEISEIIELIDN